MRPQQQNRRMRGRNNGGGGNNNNNNNNRKGPNPLTRNYESNGPDVKIRGSAQQIAEKYAQLARDAQSSGDRVMAENYLQHAEHYNRIIAAAQAQMPIQNMQNQRDASDDDMDDDRDEFDNSNNAGQGNVGQGNVAANGSQPITASTMAARPSQPERRQRRVRAAAAGNLGSELGSGPQPVIDGTPAEVALNPEAVRGQSRPRARRQRRTTAMAAKGRRNRRPRRGERSRPEAE